MAMLLGTVRRGSDPAPAVSAVDIKREAQRRIIAVVGADSFDSCVAKQLNALMRSAEINNKQSLGVELTPEEQAEKVALQEMADGIKSIRLVSNVLEQTLPHDFQDDKYWG